MLLSPECANAVTSGDVGHVWEVLKVCPLLPYMLIIVLTFSMVLGDDIHIFWFLAFKVCFIPTGDHHFIGVRVELCSP